MAFVLSLLVSHSTYQYNFDPLKLCFYLEKTGVYKGIHYFFLFPLKNINCGGSNEYMYPQSLF